MRRLLIASASLATALGGLVPLAGPASADPVTLSASPNSNLPSGPTLVTVTGTGYTAGEALELRQCRDVPGNVTCGATTPVVADAVGSISAQMTVAFEVQPGATCGDSSELGEACYIATFAAGAPNNMALMYAQLAFAASTPPPPAPTGTVTATPSQDLSTSRPTNITVTGAVFAPGGQVQLQQCVGSPTSPTCVPLAGTVKVGTGGTFSTQAVVRYFVGGTACAPACYLRAVDTVGGVVRASTGIVFAAVPILTVEPATGLRDGDLVTVRGSGFTPNARTALAQVAQRLQGRSWRNVASVPYSTRTDATGSFVVTFNARYVLRGAWPCLTSPTARCVVQASQRTLWSETPITFAAG